MTSLKVRKPLPPMPLAGTYGITCANILVYVACCIASEAISPDPEVLFRAGAIYNEALARHEYWRIVAATFLHFNLLHLLSNMICLLSWGGLVERRIGTSYFCLIYLLSGIGASLASMLLHQSAYFGVGASGAIAGLVGALFALWMLQRIELTAQFFIVNIGLNLILMSGPLQVDWQAHLGGFVAGMVVTAVLDPLEYGLSAILMHRFPEAVKFNTLLLVAAAGVAALVMLGVDPTALDRYVLHVASVIALALLVVKGVDVILGLKRGLAGLVLAFAICYGAAAWWLAAMVLAASGGVCPRLMSRLVGSAAPCQGMWLPLGVGVAVALIAIVMMWGDLRRGLADTGNLRLIFRAARRRSTSL